MRWTVPVRVDPRRVMEKLHLIDRTLNRNRAKMNAAGSPCTSWKNASISKDGHQVSDVVKCYCWNEQEAQPDRRHSLCIGLGVLGNRGYQRYGYEEYVFSTPSPDLVKSSGIQISTGNKPNDRFIISAATTQETITTPWIPLTRFKEVDRFWARESTNPQDNRVKYYYTLDDVNWNEILMKAVSDNELASHETSTGHTWNTDGITSTGQIKFQIRLQKRTTTVSSPLFNSIRFRYRNQTPYGKLNDRFSNITVPAFLAAREQPTEEIQQGETGWTTKRPIRWWTLPEANIEKTDIIEFLEGEKAGTKHLLQNLVKYQYGPVLQTLHRSFETRFIRDDLDLLGIAHLLT